VVEIRDIVVLSLARSIRTDIMPSRVDEVRIPSLAITKISTAFCAVYMLAAIGQVLLKGFVIDEGSIARLAGKRNCYNSMRFDGAG
jgi:hypothetical protein